MCSQIARILDPKFQPPAGTSATGMGILAIDDGSCGPDDAILP